MKVEIGNVKIKVDKKTITLNLKQVELLFNELNKIFGPKYIYPLSSGTISVYNGDSNKFNPITSTVTTTDLVTLTTTGSEINLDTTNS